MSDYRRYLRRTERLAHPLITMRFPEPAGIWQMQLDLLELQREIQRDITSAKRRKSRDELVWLRYARWQAKILGDSLAWIMIGHQPQYLAALAHNDRVATNPKASRSDHGLEAIAAHLLTQRWGFPVIHDVTDRLRIGDITFVRPEDGALRMRTVEVKTRLLSERPGDDGKTDWHLNVELHYTLSTDEVGDDGRDPLADETFEVSAAEPTPPAALLSLDARGERQMLRMSDALAAGTAKHGEIRTQRDGSPAISAAVASEFQRPWKVLRRIIRTARKNGVATAVLEPGVVVVATYSSDGQIYPDMFNSSDLNSLLTSQAFLTDDKARNAILLYAIPPEEQKRAHLWQPYFMYDIPLRAKFDMLHKRLTLVVIVNPAWICAALERAGFDVELRPGRRGSRPEIVLRGNMHDADGRAYSAELHAIDFHLEEVAYEFKPLSYLVDVARVTLETMESALPKLSDLLPSPSARRRRKS